MCNVCIVSWYDPVIRCMWWNKSAEKNYCGYTSMAWCYASFSLSHRMMTSSNGNIFRVTGPLCAGNSPVPVNSPHKGQWRGALMSSLICARISDWVNNREAGDLRRHRGHYDVIVMDTCICTYWSFHLRKAINRTIHCKAWTLCIILCVYFLQIFARFLLTKIVNPS